jgi:hypothetical protein
MSTYAGMTPFYSDGQQGLLLLPKNYSASNKYACIFHFCGNGEVGTNLSLLLNTGFGRQQQLGKVVGTEAENVINVIVQSRQSGEISQPQCINPVIDWILKNYSVDQSVDANGKWNSIAFAGLSQGAADVWVIASWDPAVTAYGVAKYAALIKHVWPASIPSLFPNSAAYQRMAKTSVHFTHGTNDMQGCCAYWAVPDMVKALQGVGAIAELYTVQGGTHGNDTWDIHWQCNAPDDRNMYVRANAYLKSQSTKPQPAKFSYCVASGAMYYEDNGTVLNGVYSLNDGTIITPIQVF